MTNTDSKPFQWVRLSRRSLIGSALPLGLSGCLAGRVDFNNVLMRSDIISTPEQEREIVGKAKLLRSDDGRITILCTRGTPYEQGYQHGILLREEVRANLEYLYEGSLSKFHFPEVFAESFERQRPFIPQRYIDEMHGLAHGSRLPLNIVHAIHALPEMTEWGGKKRLKELVKKMLHGEALGTMCSNLAASGKSTADGRMYVVRILDWGMHRVSKLHEHPMLHVSIPDEGIPSVNIGWIGFLGAISGMNEQQITLGEMGAGDDDQEVMRGTPMPFLLREILRTSKNLADVRATISGNPGTNRFVYLMSDGKVSDAEMYWRDRHTFTVMKMGEQVHIKGNQLSPPPGVVYGGHFSERMTPALQQNNGKVTPELLMKELIPEFAMASNFQNVVYDPQRLAGWVTNAKSPTERAAEQPYTYFDFGKILREFQAEAHS